MTHEPQITPQATISEIHACKQCSQNGRHVPRPEVSLSCLHASYWPGGQMLPPFATLANACNFKRAHQKNPKLSQIFPRLKISPRHYHWLHKHDRINPG